MSIRRKERAWVGDVNWFDGVVQDVGPVFRWWQLLDRWIRRHEGGPCHHGCRGRIRMPDWLGERHHRRGSTLCLHDQDYLGLPHQRHRRKPLWFVEDRSDGGTCHWCDLLGLEASLKGSMVVFAFDYYFCDGGGGGEKRELVGAVIDGR
jgi:hypothetical protein